MANHVSFFLNGRQVRVEDPAPDLFLIDYLRSPEVGLAGPKKACGQGGCGACTVVLSHWNGTKPVHRAVNSCLRPVCALGGMVVTTVEGTGRVRQPSTTEMPGALVFSRGVAPANGAVPPVVEEAAKAAREKNAAVHADVTKARAALESKPPLLQIAKQTANTPSEVTHEGANPVAYRLALNNGSQCGYCSVGFVMNMTEFLANKPQATKKQIEEALDGNLCRCTGYRSILTGMKTFASDWTAEDEALRMKCVEDPTTAAQKPGPLVIPFPDSAREPLTPVESGGEGQYWTTPRTLAELAATLHQNRQKRLRLVHGNTSFGVYKAEFSAVEVFVDIRLVPELNAAPEWTETALTVSAGTVYDELIALLETAGERGGAGEATRLGAALFMARRTAGRIVRNAASIGGNTMMVLEHILKSEPFPSDLLTSLAAIAARIHLLELDDEGAFHDRSQTVDELVAYVIERPEWVKSLVLRAYELPKGDPEAEVVLAQKVALREVNSHSIVNVASCLKLDPANRIEHAVLVLGGIAPYPWRPVRTESALCGKPLGLEGVGELMDVLAAEVREQLERWKDRMRGLPDEGFTDDYRVQLATSFIYKTLVNAMLARGLPVPDQLASSGEITWGKWPVSDGEQHYVTQDYKQPVGQPYIKITALYQASGQIHYTHELPAPPLTLNAAFVQSKRALANFFWKLPGKEDQCTLSEIRAWLQTTEPNFVDLITAENIRPGGVNLLGMGSDQPLFATQMVNYVGQSIALAIAETEEDAIVLAAFITEHCIGYGPVAWPAPFDKPVLRLEEAIAIDSVFPDAPLAASFASHIWKITRPGSRFDWVENRTPLDREPFHREGVIIDGVQCAVIGNAQSCGGQAHFYMETQACVVEPIDENRFIVHPSSQSPMEMHQTAMQAMGLRYHQIEVNVTSVGGGFGGKTEQAKFVTGAAAVASQAMKRPVRLAMPRDEDTLMIGKRHAYYGQYQIAVDSTGILRGLQAKLWGDGGAFYDCSFIVSNCVQLRTDNAYLIKNFQSQIDVCRTNTAPSTAMRSFGDVQGKNIIENAIDDAAFAGGFSPEELRERNMYQQGDVTPFGQALSSCYMRQVWTYLKQQADYEGKRQAVEEFNRGNRWRKRGLGMIPVKYGSGYNLLMLEQATAVVAISQVDGSVFIHQGGVEMGQGLITQVQQVACYVLNLPMQFIFVDGPKTAITPNPTSTGASTGTPYSCEAVKQTCQELRNRLLAFGYKMREENGDVWCAQQNVDFWNHAEGWAACYAPGKTIWTALVSLAYQNRVNLIANFTSKIRGGEVPVPAMAFKPQDEQPNPPGIERDKGAVLGGGVDSFVGFTYSAALSVVEVDVLTGEATILSSDIMYDMGWSMNPAIDIGQVEGAFVQGVGYLTSEQLVFQSEGEDIGRLNGTNTWRYKIPATTSIPLKMNTRLFPRNLASVVNIPEDPNQIFSAKEVGEPPLVLANSVFFAIKAAIRASRLERGLNGLFRFDAPATVQQIRKACDVSLRDLK